MKTLILTLLLSIPTVDTTPPTHHWRLVAGHDGQLYRERRHSRLGILIAGLSILVSSYVITAALGPRTGVLYAPVIGPYVAIPQSKNAGDVGWLALGGIAQVSGLVLTIIGATGANPNRIERQRFSAY
jgi:hypothetical protein